MDPDIISVVNSGSGRSYSFKPYRYLVTQKLPEASMVHLTLNLREHEHTAICAARVEYPLSECDGEIPVVLKLAFDEESFNLLLHEYGFYSNQLLSLQGRVVPMCYGLYRKCDSEQNAVGCLILEECIGSHPEPDDENEELDSFYNLNKDSRDDYVRKLMLGLCEVHKAGVCLNQPPGSRLGLRHGEDVRIIDFSKASVHDNCPNSVPAPLPDATMVSLYDLNDSHETIYLPGCTELDEIERWYNFRRTRTIQRSCSTYSSYSV